MAFTLNDMRARAAQFAKDWKDAAYERGETQSFYNDFFSVFGVNRRRVGVYEKQVAKLSGHTGFIDLFWPGMLLVEQKSAGRNLAAARQQALDYAAQLKQGEEPKYILISDFQTFELLDLETGNEVKFKLHELPDHVEDFNFISGRQKIEYRDQDAVNIQASELMGQLYDELKASGYPGHALEMYLVRLLFLFFADDTGLFERDSIVFYLENNTVEDGSDLGLHIQQIFQVVNQPKENRQILLNEDLKPLEYVNGGLFAEILPIANFSRAMRERLLACAHFDWSKISPAIFGSLFQSVMEPQKRRGIGAHYTSEKNIMKVIHPLFLDELWAEFERIKTNRRLLQEFHERLGKLTFFDPACGCGNFLILAYRALRELEIEVLKVLHPEKGWQGDKKLAQLDLGDLSIVRVDQFYGIEIEEFPARIAETAMWLMDHLMNRKLSEAFGVYYNRLPLSKAANIVYGNAMQVDWKTVLAPEKATYILGNPPFVGSKMMTETQRKEIMDTFARAKGAGVLDYVCGWYAKAGEYIQHNPNIRVAFVSTNSITQGEQVGILWNEMFNRYGIKIYFAHRTFSWTSEARGKAGVYVVIIGLGKQDVSEKHLFVYDDIRNDPVRIVVKSISPYLVEGSSFALTKRTTPISDVPEILFGNQPIDGGHLIYSSEERQELLARYPDASILLKAYVGAEELINGSMRWVLWLKNISPELIRKFPPVLERIAKVKEFRMEGAAREKFASKPSLFASERHPENGQYIAIPSVSSERRNYIPIVFLDTSTIASNLCLIIPSANLYHFGVLTSHMHMAWTRAVCGRLEGRYRYSNQIVYNNYPWPDATPQQEQEIGKLAQAVLDARLEFPNATLADLYDPNTMPTVLLKAHHALDRALDRLYRKDVFPDERTRVEFLFDRYLKLLDPLGVNKKTKSRSKKKMDQGIS